MEATKEIYTTPTMQIVELPIESIICVSPGNPFDGLGEETVQHNTSVYEKYICDSFGRFDDDGRFMSESISARRTEGQGAD